MDMTAGQVVVIAAGGILGKEILVYLWRKFIKVADGDYVTDKTCKACQSKREDADREFKKEVRENFGQIKGILLVLAAGEKVTMEDLQKLISRG